MIALKAMEQIWVGTVYEKFRLRVAEALESELINTVSIEKLSLIKSRKDKIIKAYKIMRKLEKNQRECLESFIVGEPKRSIEDSIIFSNKLQNLLLASYERVLKESLAQSDTLVGFRNLVK